MNAPRSSEQRGHAILLAAGLGRRLGAGSSKGFVELLGRPLLCWSLETFASHPAIGEIVIVLPPGDRARDRCRIDVTDPMGLTTRVALAEGGERRQDSSYFGIGALSRDVLDDPESVVLIHDAARPLVSSFLITRCLREMLHTPDAVGCLPALPVKETVKRVKDSWIETTIDRSDLMTAQTPQVFRLGPLRRAHEQARSGGIAVTDDAMLLESVGMRIRAVPGDIENIKITYPEDRILAERLIRERETR